MNHIRNFCFLMLTVRRTNSTPDEKAVLAESTVSTSLELLVVSTFKCNVVSCKVPLSGNFLCDPQ